MTDTTTVFQSGNSQAVRLPKEFRFKSKTVEIFRRGDEVVLREKPRTLGHLLQQAFAGLAPLTVENVAEFDEAMALARQPQAQQERDWSWMDPSSRASDAATKKARKAPRSRAKA